MLQISNAESSMFVMAYNGGNMISWAFWNTNLSIYYNLYLMLKCSYLPLSAQFIILRVCALHEHAAHTRRMLDKKFKYTNLIETYTMGGGNIFQRV